MLIKSKNLNKIDLLAVVNIYSSSNNTIINISNLYSKTLFCGSTGFLGIKGSRRSTSYAGQSICNIFGKKLFAFGIKYVLIKIKGFGRSRYASIKAILLSGLKLTSIQDVTSIPFNGCKPPKKRRI